ncbi:MAG: metalloregulator ArsR/SmtB family transcription factor [Thermacetogeniaceae bacterium]
MDGEKDDRTTGAPDVCEIFIYDAEKVNRMKEEVKATEGLSLFFKALADDTRLKIVYALAREELCVCDVANMLGLTVQAASHHLRFLRDTGLAKYRKSGKIVFYTLNNRRIARLVEMMVQELTGGWQ